MTAMPVRLEGAPNFRDLGGRATADGRRVAQRRVFRSGNLSRLTAADFELLRGIPLRTIVELRSSAETALYPFRLPESLGAALVEAGVNPYTHAEAGGYKQLLIDDPSPAGAMRTMAATYRLLPKVCGPAIKAVVDRLLVADGALSFNCSNGRDRTGVVSMMLLHILGVPRDGIVADYLESNARIDLEAAIELSRVVFMQEYGIEFDYQTLRTMNQALEQNVDIAFDAIAETYGSVDAYLDAAGVDAATRQALRTKLLEDA